MANNTLTGNDWSTDGDWDTATKAADGDVVAIPDTNGNNIIMSADEAGVNCASITVNRGFAKQFGTSASPIKIAADLMLVYGSQGFFFEADDAPADAHSMDRVEIQLPDGDTPCELGTEAGADTGTWLDLLLARGDILLKQNIAWHASAFVQVGWTTNPTDDVKCTIASGGPTLPKLIQTGGVVKSNSVITEAHVGAGRMEHDLAKITTLFIHPGGVVDYNHLAVGGDATVIHVYPGATLNLSANTKFKTVTTVNEWPGSHVFFDRSLVTITNHNNMNDVGN